MRMNKKYESENIAETIKFIMHGPFRERKEYQQELFKNGRTILNGYEINRDTYSFVIWKGKQNDWGEWEQCYKVVPRKVDDDIEAMKTILDAQKWTWI